MITRMKLPLWIRAALWISVTGGFVALALATFSLLFKTSFPLSRPGADNRCAFLSLVNGQLSIQSVSAVYLEKLQNHQITVCYGPPVVFDARLCRVSTSDDGGYVSFALIPIGMVFLLGFLWVAWKASRMRRAAILEFHDRESSFKKSPE